MLSVATVPISQAVQVLAPASLNLLVSHVRQSFIEVSLYVPEGQYAENKVSSVKNEKVLFLVNSCLELSEGRNL